VAIDVADTGPSLGIELLAQLFKPFVKRRKDGTGLGLWISGSAAVLRSATAALLFARDRVDGTPGAVFTVRLKAAVPG
jgi:C4-dicarboxylate-specific signal transduction histidine kinase